MEEKNRPISNPAQPTSALESTFVPPSEFRGRTIQLIGWQLLGILLSLITLGIGTPWAHCMVIRWETRHTYVNGKQLCFEGKGHQLLGKYLLWGLLTLVTLGIFALFIPVRMHKWRASHTHFAKPGQVQKGISGGVIFGIIMAAIAVAAVAALVAVLLTPKTGGPRPTESLPSGVEGFRFYVDEDGNFCIIGPDGPSNITVTPDQIEDITGSYGGQVITAPPAENTQPPVQNTDPQSTEKHPTEVSGPILGGWLMPSSHISGSSDVTVYRFNRDGTFSCETGLYDFHGYSVGDHYEGWSYFLNGYTVEGWYTYEDGLLTLHSTRSMEWGGSEGGVWHDFSKETVQTHQVSFSADGDRMYFANMNAFTDEWTTPLGYFQRMTGSAIETLDHYFPEGMK